MLKQVKRKFKIFNCNSCKNSLFLKNKNISSNYCPRCGYPLPQTKQKLKNILKLISSYNTIELKYRTLLLNHLKNLIFNDISFKMIVLLILKKLNKKIKENY